jgi:hypothetical protein
MALGLGTALRQLRTRRRLAEERFLPSDERKYLSGQVRRRVVVGVVLVGIGGMIAGYYLSGMDGRMDEIMAKGKPADGDVDPADKQFAKMVGFYWIGVLGLVFIIAVCAVLDFWATRTYWMAQYRLIKQDHETKLRRDLAVYRQAKDNDRMHGRGRSSSDDETDESPPVE